MTPNSPLAPSPLSKDEPPSGLDCSGDFKAAPDIRIKRAGSRWRVFTGSGAKGQGTGARPHRRRTGHRRATRPESPWLTPSPAFNLNPNGTALVFLKIATHP